MRSVAVIVLLSSGIAHADDVCATAREAVDAQRWSEAEVLLDRCASTTAPSWLEAARAQVAPNLDTLAPITIDVAPGSAEVTVSTFPSGVRFSARTIHLPSGTHIITATAPGHTSQQRTVRVIDLMPQRATFDLVSLAPPPPPPPEPTIGPWLVIGTGAAIMLAGATYHIVELLPVRNRLADAADPAHDPDLERYAADSEEFDRRRRNTLAIYGVGLATLVGGVVWRFVEYRRYRAEVTTVPTRGGAVIGLSWQL